MSKQRNRLDAQVMANRRETVYKMMKKRHCGKVPCFVCRQPVQANEATIEHIIPRSKGGSDAVNNLSVSHRNCNMRRGNDGS